MSVSGGRGDGRRGAAAGSASASAFPTHDPSGLPAALPPPPRPSLARSCRLFWCWNADQKAYLGVGTVLYLNSLRQMTLLFGVLGLLALPNAVHNTGGRYTLAFVDNDALDYASAHYSLANSGSAAYTPGGDGACSGRGFAAAACAEWSPGVLDALDFPCGASPFTVPTPTYAAAVRSLLTGEAPAACAAPLTLCACFPGWGGPTCAAPDAGNVKPPPPPVVPAGRSAAANATAAAWAAAASIPGWCTPAPTSDGLPPWWTGTDAATREAGRNKLEADRVPGVCSGVGACIVRPSSADATRPLYAFCQCDAGHYGALCDEDETGAETFGSFYNTPVGGNGGNNTPAALPECGVGATPFVTREFLGSVVTLPTAECGSHGFGLYMDLAVVAPASTVSLGGLMPMNVSNFYRPQTRGVCVCEPGSSGEQCLGGAPVPESQGAWMMITMLVSLGGVALMYRNRKDAAAQLDDMAIEPTDFSLFFNDMPPLDAANEGDLARVTEHFEQWGPVYAVSPAPGDSDVFYYQREKNAVLRSLQGMLELRRRVEQIGAEKRAAAAADRAAAAEARAARLEAVVAAGARGAGAARAAVAARASDARAAATDARAEADALAAAAEAYNRPPQPHPPPPGSPAAAAAAAAARRPPRPPPATSPGGWRERPAWYPVLSPLRESHVPRGALEYPPVTYDSGIRLMDDPAVEAFWDSVAPTLRVLSWAGFTLTFFPLPAKRALVRYLDALLEEAARDPRMTRFQRGFVTFQYALDADDCALSYSDAMVEEASVGGPGEPPEGTQSISHSRSGEARTVNIRFRAGGDDAGRRKAIAAAGMGRGAAVFKSKAEAASAAVAARARAAAPAAGGGLGGGGGGAPGGGGPASTAAAGSVRAGQVAPLPPGGGGGGGAARPASVHEISVARAHAPDEIEWQTLDTSAFELNVRQTAVSIWLVLVVALLYEILTTIGKVVPKKGSLATLAVLTVNVINALVSRHWLQLSEIEMNYYNGTKNRSIYYKVLLTQLATVVLSSVLGVFGYPFDAKNGYVLDWYHDAGSFIFKQVAIETVLPPLLALLPLEQLRADALALVLGVKSHTRYMIQHAPARFDLDVRCATFMRNVIVVCAFSAGLPLLNILMAACAFARYCSDVVAFDINFRIQRAGGELTRALELTLVFAFFVQAVMGWAVLQLGRAPNAAAAQGIFLAICAALYWVLGGYFTFKWFKAHDCCCGAWEAAVTALPRVGRAARRAWKRAHSVVMEFVLGEQFFGEAEDNNDETGGRTYAELAVRAHAEVAAGVRAGAGGAPGGGLLTETEMANNVILRVLPYASLERMQQTSRGDAAPGGPGDPVPTRVEWSGRQLREWLRRCAARARDAAAAQHALRVSAAAAAAAALEAVLAGAAGGPPPPPAAVAEARAAFAELADAGLGRITAAGAAAAGVPPNVWAGILAGASADMGATPSLTWPEYALLTLRAGGCAPAGARLAAVRAGSAFDAGALAEAAERAAAHTRGHHHRDVDAAGGKAGARRPSTGGGGGAPHHPARLHRHHAGILDDDGEPRLPAARLDAALNALRLPPPALEAARRAAAAALAASPGGAGATAAAAAAAGHPHAHGAGAHALAPAPGALSGGGTLTREEFVEIVAEAVAATS